MLKTYYEHAKERQVKGIPALPLDHEQTHALTLLIEKPPLEANSDFLLDLLN